MATGSDRLKGSKNNFVHVLCISSRELPDVLRLIYDAVEIVIIYTRPNP